MIGNNYEKDIIGAKDVGMNTVFVDRQKPCMLGDENVHVHSLRELMYYL
jgi:FMN phosphatase YigB (HAD superfamily)